MSENEELQKINCEVCEGSGQICSFKGVSRFALSWEDCPACGGMGFTVSARRPDKGKMKSKKEQILLTIYSEFEKWSAPLPCVCTKGCSTCCTRNVTITALEGERILNFIRQEGLEQWFAGRLQISGPVTTPLMTTNEYAAACLQGIETDDPGPPGNSAPCPFLEKDCCAIYPVRPFGCRCFASEHPCTSAEAAFLPDFYIAASTTMMQIIEHLGQREYWGNMLDVLLALCDISTYKKIAQCIPDRSIIIQARIRTRKARPLPGFLLLEEEQEKVDLLLHSIFSTRIEGISIEEILNGRERTL